MQAASNFNEWIVRLARLEKKRNAIILFCPSTLGAIDTPSSVVPSRCNLKGRDASRRKLLVLLHSNTQELNVLPVLVQFYKHIASIVKICP